MLYEVITVFSAFGEHGLAVANYEEAVRRGARSRSVLLKLGRSWLGAGNPDMARPVLLEALSVSPGDREVLELLESLPR